ncbi:MAG: AAA domain-containing protein, partial [Candidatus Nitrosopolaris sp.]
MSYPNLRKYTLDNIVVDIDGVNSFNMAEVGRKYFQNAEIILTTAYSAKDLANVIQVDAVIVDETGLVGLDTMPMLFSSLRHDNGKILVIGDDKQLPPASHDFVGYSLFSSILRQHETTLLKTEYRFNEDILDLINPNYQYQLKADHSVKDISTADIATKSYNGTNNNLTKILDHENRIVFVDTNGCSREEKHFINTGEISVVKELIDGFLSMGIDDIIITTPNHPGCNSFRNPCAHIARSINLLTTMAVSFFGIVISPLLILTLVSHRSRITQLSAVIISPDSSLYFIHSASSR